MPAAAATARSRHSSAGHGWPHLAADACICPICQAKTTKKITLKLTCNACKAVRLKPIKRAKHFEICDKKPKTKGQMY